MFNNIFNFFKKILGIQGFKGLEVFMYQVFTQERTLVLAAIKDIAIQAVATAQTTGLNSTDKRAQAYGQIVAYAKNKGIDVGDSMINLAIEMAVSALKKG